VNKQLVNLIGAAASIAILLLGILVCALPVFSSANTTMSTADDVALQNQTQQSILDGLRAQSGQLADIQQDVAELRREIPETEHVEDLVELAVEATVVHGGSVRSVIPGDIAPFTPRTLEVVAAEAAADGATTGAPAPEATATPTDETAAPPTETAEPTTPAEVDPTAPQQVPVVVTIDAPTVAAATLILDALRNGPRMISVTEANVLTEEGGVTLTATVLAFYRP
jgi:hypothetical protein